MLDLTKPLNEDTPVYSEGTYRDPPIACTTWCTIEDQGYWVSRIACGTQSGTHIDAPAHFDKNGATLENLPLQRCVGRYLFIDLSAPPRFATAQYRQEPILFVNALKAHAVEAAVFEELLKLPADLWVVAGNIEIPGRDKFFFHRALAQAGKFLVEDLENGASAKVAPGGELIVLPLRLTGVSGSPCRVVVREKAEV